MRTKLTDTHTYTLNREMKVVLRQADVFNNLMRMIFFQLQKKDNSSMIRTLIILIDLSIYFHLSIYYQFKLYRKVQPTIIFVALITLLVLTVN